MCVYAEAADSQEGMKGPSPAQTAPKRSDSTDPTPNPVKSAFPLGATCLACCTCSSKHGDTLDLKYLNSLQQQKIP